MTTQEQRAEWARLAEDGTFHTDESDVIDALLADLAAAEAERDAAREALRTLKSCPDCGANFEGEPYPWREDQTRLQCDQCAAARAALAGKGGDDGR